MLKIEYDLLKYIQENQPIFYTDLINGFCADHNMTVSECDDILQCLLEDHYLDIGGPIQNRRSATFRLPSRTTQRTYQYAQECSEKARQEKNQRQLAYISAFAGIFGAAVGAILTVILSRIS